jgi:hypothetical protein
MPNYEIKIQVHMAPTEQDVTSEITPCDDGGFRVVMSHESGQSIDQCEQALLALNYPVLREALSRHLSEVSKRKAETYGVGVLKKTLGPTRSTAK